MLKIMFVCAPFQELIRTCAAFHDVHAREDLPSNMA